MYVNWGSASPLLTISPKRFPNSGPRDGNVVKPYFLFVLSKNEISFFSLIFSPFREVGEKIKSRRFKRKIEKVLHATSLLWTKKSIRVTHFEKKTQSHSSQTNANLELFQNSLKVNL